jgi:hypothetical protein
VAKAETAAGSPAVDEAERGAQGGRYLLVEPVCF